MSRMATAPAAIATDHASVSARFATIPTSLPTNSSPESIGTPSILATWLTRMSSASPPTNPTRIGFDRKLARKPSLNTDASTNMTPLRIAWASAIVA